MTGAVSAYLGLAYNLYLLAHNARVQEILLKRLRKRDQFYGAYYETYVAAVLIKAGFEIEFEDETDGSTSHCELTATFIKTGKKFSVEAKARGPNKTSVDVGNQLFNALKKKADHARVVFIEANVPDERDSTKTLETLGNVLKSVRSREEKLTINRQPAPPAYIIVTNNPHAYDLNAAADIWAVAEGFKIPDFKVDGQFVNLRNALEAREKHLELFCLIKSLREHREIPSTFDGDNPELAFEESRSRFRIGEKYMIPDVQGKEVAGELVVAAVTESKKVAIGAFKLLDGTQILAECPMTDKEVAAYRKHPDTFFGVVRRQPKGIKDPIEFYDFVYECYSKSSKQKLLEFLNNASDIERLRQLSQEELAKLYSERVVYEAFRNVEIPNGPATLLRTALHQQKPIVDDT